MGAVGLQTHIWSNNTKSVLLLAGFPVLLLGLVYAGQLGLMGAGFLPATGSIGGDIRSAFVMLGVSAPVAFVAAGGWFGVDVARRFPLAAVRGFVITTGSALAVYYFLRT